MMGLALYRGIATAAGPLIRSYLGRRLRAGKEDPARLSERFGLPSVARPGGAVIWVHAASVGESLSILPLIERLVSRRGLSLMMTTGTVTSARLLANRLPTGVIHQFVPIDRPGWVRTFLDHWRPGLVLWLESELWPATLSEIAKRRIPAILLNARLSPGSHRNWRRMPRTARRILSTFSLCLAQSREDADRLTELHAPNVRYSGNLKHAAPPLPCDEMALATLRGALADRPVWLAASTHPGEEAMVGTAHARLQESCPETLLVVVPRHPHRGPEIAAELGAAGFDVGLRSAGAALGGDITIADGLGELGLFFRLADIAFIGGTLVPHGGQNPLEPARLNCAIIHGPYTTNFAEITAELAAADAALAISTPDELASALTALSHDSSRRAYQVAAAAALAGSKLDILETVLEEIAPFLEALPAGDAEA